MPRSSKRSTAAATAEPESLAARFRASITNAAGGELIIPSPHPAQLRFLEADSPRRILACHRRWGKDWGTIMDIHRRIGAWKGEPHRRQLSPRIAIGIVYPTNDLARDFWEALKAMTPAGEVVSTYENAPRRMTFACGAEVQVRSGSDPDKLVAAGYDMVVLGEAARLSGKAWQQVLPMLASPGRGPRGEGGWAVLQSTFKGPNWFADEYNAGLKSGRWWTLRAPIWKEGTEERHELANPHVRDKVILEQREQMTARMFDQEWRCVILSETGSVFPGIRACVAPSPAPPEWPLVAGVDLGKRQDFSACVIWDSLGRMVHAWRDRGKSYPLMAQEIIDQLGQWQANVAVIESNGPGDPFFDWFLLELHKRRREFKQLPRLVGYPTTAQSKRAMVEALVIAFQRGSATVLDDEDLVNEFEGFEVTHGPTGTPRYGTPPGKDDEGDERHDDRVMAACLGWTEVELAEERITQQGALPDAGFLARQGMYPGARPTSGLTSYERHERGGRGRLDRGENMQ